MLIQNLIVRRYFLWSLPLLAMLFQLAGPSSAAALSGAYVVDTAMTIPVSNLIVHPPSPCDQAILSGDFVIQAHIVHLFTSTMYDTSIVTLHLDATGISGTCLDSTLYQGSQGTSQDFTYTGDPMIFDATFNLVPKQPNPFPPSPGIPVQLAFQVQIYTAEGGIPALSVSILPSE